MNSRKDHPPALAIRILQWFCPDELQEGILSDFDEQYHNALKSNGTRKANIKYFWNVLRLFHPSIFLRNKQIHLMRTGIIRSHLVVATRSMSKYKFYSLVNIIGLSLGVTFTLLVFLFVKKETGYDNFHKNGKNIYRVASTITKKKTGEITSKSAVTAVPVGKKLLEDVPSVIAATRYASISVTAIHNNAPINEVAYFVDPAFLEMFSFPIIQGSKEALLLKSNLAISKSKAEQYFGTTDPIGESITFIINDTEESFIIQAVIDEKREESSLEIDFLLPFDAFSLITAKEVIESFNYGILENYVQLKPGANINEVAASCSAALNFHIDDDSMTDITLQPLTDIHLENTITGNADYSDPMKLYILSGLAFLVLLVSVINFMTLSTGHALVRLKEIGLRKSFGATKRMLHFQLIIEAFALSFLASLIGLAFAWLLLPLFNQLLNTSIDLDLSLDVLLFLLSISALIAIVNGSLQALIMVNFKVINALQEKSSTKNGSGLFSQSLIVVQFSISIILIIGTIIIRSQLHYIQNKDLGFEKENLIQMSIDNLSNSDAINSLIDMLKSQYLRNNRILSVSASMNNSTEPWTTLTFIQEDGSEEKLSYNLVSYDYLETMGIELVSGNFFEQEKGNASTDIVVNEALVKHFGWENPINQQIPGRDFNETHRIIGVVKNFHISSLKSKINPLILTINEETILEGVSGLTTYMWPPKLNQLYIRFSPGEIAPVLDLLSKIWKDSNAKSPFEFSFVDESVALKYSEEKRWGDIVNSASIFAIFIAWMGLVGLTRLSVQRRTKEIGIRKILGSSTMQVASLLSGKFLQLVLIANIISWPITYWIAESWLASFMYRVEISPLIFVIAGLSVVGLVTLSIGFQSFLAAKSNPVNSLRYE